MKFAKNAMYHNKQALGQICQLLTPPTQLTAAETIIWSSILNNSKITGLWFLSQIFVAYMYITHCTYTLCSWSMQHEKKHFKESDKASSNLS